jgi:hypothetical protein
MKPRDLMINVDCDSTSFKREMKEVTKLANKLSNAMEKLNKKKIIIQIERRQIKKWWQIFKL